MTIFELTERYVQSSYAPTRARTHARHDIESPLPPPPFMKGKQDKGRQNNADINYKLIRFAQ
jgi:hypothetical protein